MKMKKFETKLKLVLYSVATFAMAFLFGALLVCGNLGKNGSELATSAINYGNTSGIVRQLRDDQSQTESSFDLSTSFPILAENQTDSNFCWAYASTKALETAFMVQADEFHNFSETGIALVAYLNGVKNVFNSEGNFFDFCTIMQNFGLVYESDFSNDEFSDIFGRISNSNKYDFVLDYVDGSLAENVLPVCFEFDETYQNLKLAPNLRKELIKKYIKNYGGLFAGLQKGTYYSNGETYGVYYPIEDITNASDNAIYKSQNHAVCIIGWDDNFDGNGNGGWLAINSWGVNSSIYEKFYIPYEYEYVYNTFAGFEYRENVNIETLNSTANKGVKNFDILENIFSFGDDIEVTYEFGDKVDFDSVYFSVSRGKQDVTYLFESSFNSNDKTMTLNFSAANQLAGTYLVKFFSGSNLIGTKEIFVYSGTEIAYIEFSANTSAAFTGDKEDSVALLGSHSTSENSATFYIDIKNNNTFNFELFKNDFSSNDISLSVGEVYLTYVDGGVEKSERIASKYGASGGNFTDFSIFRNNARFRLNFLSDTNPVGKMVEFNLSISAGAGMPVREINVKIIISETTAGTLTKSSDAFAIEYVLGGGINNEKNIDRFPDYAKETSMTSFFIYPASRLGGEIIYDFAGWYLDPTFETEFVTDGNGIGIIDASTPRETLVLYAKWSSTETSYFEGELKILEILGYDKTQKSSDLIYGDSVLLGYDFVAKPALDNTNYIVNYIYTVNGKKLESTSDSNLELSFPNLEAGDYDIEVFVQVIISRQFSVSDSDKVKFSVAKKQTSISFENLSHKFDGKTHAPSSPVYSGVYSEDLEDLMFVFDTGEKIYADTYKFNVLSLSNKNYELVGQTAFDFEITKRELVANWKNTVVSYNGNLRLPEIELLHKDDGEVPTSPVNASVLIFDGTAWIENGIKNAKTYKVKLSQLSSSNYTIVEGGESEFEIKPAKITIKFEDVRERLQTAPNNRKALSYTLLGTVFGEDELGIKTACAGLNANESGKYAMTATHTNKNYELVVESATYTLVGEYKVYYTLPNGVIYEEIVEDGESPKGITSDIYKLPALSSFSYNIPLEYNGDDLYVTVTIINYTWIVVIVAIIIVFIAIYAIVTHKMRKNKVR